MDKKKKEIKKLDNEKLTQEEEQLKKEAEEYKNKYLRALADYQNFEKRVKEERNQLVRTANLNLIMRLLPFLDNLEKAQVFIKDQGLRIAKDHLFQSLKEIGIEEIDVLNKPFDPNVAEAIDIVKGDKDNIVVEVLRKGYRIEDKILRVAQVRVSKKLEIRNPCLPAGKAKSETNSNF